MESGTLSPGGTVPQHAASFVCAKPKELFLGRKGSEQTSRCAVLPMQDILRQTTVMSRTPQATALLFAHCIWTPCGKPPTYRVRKGIDVDSQASRWWEFLLHERSIFLNYALY